MAEINKNTSPSKTLAANKPRLVSQNPFKSSTNHFVLKKEESQKSPYGVNIPKAAYLVHQSSQQFTAKPVLTSASSQNYSQFSV